MSKDSRHKTTTEILQHNHKARRKGNNTIARLPQTKHKVTMSTKTQTECREQLQEDAKWEAINKQQDQKDHETKKTHKETENETQRNHKEKKEHNHKKL